jgi:hypothetical protein
MTHSAIAELSPFTDALTLDEMEELVEAAQNNNQIAWILTDEDVRHFHEPLLESLYDNKRLKKAEFKKRRQKFGLDVSSSATSI